LAAGHAVIALDNLSTGSRANIAHLLSHPRFQLLVQDVAAPLSLPPVDAIYNFACPASPLHYQADPIHTLKTSVLGALNLLEIAKSRHIPIFQASTSEVYGDPHIHPQPEGYWGHVNPIGPRACYDEGKRCAETLFFDYHRMHGVPIRVGRIFNTYGPRMHPHDGRVVSNFVVQALQNLPLTIYGDGSQTRSFCYVDDLIDVIMLLMDSPHTGPFNIGNPAEFQIAELAELVIELTGSSSPIEKKPLPIDDPRQRRPDIRRAQTELGWTPKISLRQGLEATIAHFDALLKRPLTNLSQ
jgi:UDP-glucuronate decarboxylase